MPSRNNVTTLTFIICTEIGAWGCSILVDFSNRDKPQSTARFPDYSKNVPREKYNARRNTIFVSFFCCSFLCRIHDSNKHLAG
jgi:hypothetical protein